MRAARIVGIIVLAIVVLLILAMIAGAVAFAVGGSHFGAYYGFMPMMRNFGIARPGLVGAGIVALLFVLLVLVAIGALIAWAISRGQRRAMPAGPSSSNAALETLKERYARGEIDHEEFQRRKELLQSS